MIIKTSSIIYDERLKKEVESLVKQKIDVTVFAIEDIQSGQAAMQCKVFNPKFIINSNKNLFIKLIMFIELIIRLMLQIKIKNYDRIWVHDPIMIFLIPFLYFKNSKIIFDLHELPPSRVLKNQIFKKIFTYFAKRSVIIVPNVERGDYLKENEIINNYFVLHNYPSISVINNVDYIDKEFEDWIEGKEFAYCQSATEPSRNFESLAKACVIKKLHLIVVGEKNDIYEKARVEVPNFEKYIKVLGKKPSERLPYYFEKAKFSIVFYSDMNLNNILCAPNRMFHSILQGVPVLVGKNPTMKNIVNKFRVGVSIDSYGDDVESISNGIDEMNKYYKFYKFNTHQHTSTFVWEKQDSIINQVVNSDL